MAHSSVFLSYARDDDEPFVKKLYESLTVSEFRVWWDRVSMPQRALTFIQEIRDAVEAAQCLVLVVGPSAAKSEYVRMEWKHALECCKPVYPVLRQGDFDLLPSELALLNTPDFRDDEVFEQSLEQLLRHLYEPVAPLGELVAVPDLPPHFLSRSADLDALKGSVLLDIQKPVVVTGTARRVGLHGMGGIGKSVLAAALARDCEIRRAFPDGVLWVTIGQSPNLTLRQYDLCLSMGAPPSILFPDVDAGKALLSTVLADKACLLILDDIWKPEHAKAFDSLGPRCRMLLTTRDAELITALGAQEYRLDVLTEDDALTLMAGWLASEEMPEQERSPHVAPLRANLPRAAHEVAQECGYLPLALALSAAQVRDGTPWEDLLDALREADLEFLEHPHGSILKTLKVSVDALQQTDPDLARHYLELAVFPNNTLVPEAVLLMLWQHTAGVDERHARQLIRMFANKSLLFLEGEAPNRIIRFHDLHTAYLQSCLDDSILLHQTLIEAYQRNYPEGWHDCVDDGYIYEHLVFHLVQAYRRDLLKTLFADQRWMISRFEQDNLNYGGFVNDLDLAWESLANSDYDSETLLVDCVHFLLIRTTINSLSANHSPRLIAEAVLRGIWTIDRAVANASYVPEPEIRASILAKLVDLVPLEAQHQKEVIEHCFDAAMLIENDLGRVEALKSILPHLPSDLVKVVLDHILKIALELTPEDGLRILLATSPLIREQAKQRFLVQALALAAEDLDRWSGVWTMVQIITQLEGDPRDDAVQLGLETARIIDDEEDRAWAMAILATVIDGEARAVALTEGREAAEMILDTVSRLKAFAVLCIHLDAEQKADIGLEVISALDKTRYGHTDDYYNLLRAEALGILAQQLTEEQRVTVLAQAIDVALSINAEDYRAQVLKVLLPQLSNDLFDIVSTALETFSGNAYRAEVYASVLGALNEEHKVQAITQCIDWLSYAEDEEQITRILLSVITHLPDNHLEAFLETACAVLTGKNQANVLLAVIPKLDEDIKGKAIEEALSAVINEDWDESTCDIVQALTKELTKRFSADNLVVRTLMRVSSKERTLHFLDLLAPCLDDDVVKTILNAGIAVGDESLRMNALTSLRHLESSAETTAGERGAQSESGMQHPIIQLVQHGKKLVLLLSAAQSGLAVCLLPFNQSVAYAFAGVAVLFGATTWFLVYGINWLLPWIMLRSAQKQEKYYLRLSSLIDINRWAGRNLIRKRLEVALPYESAWLLRPLVPHLNEQQTVYVLQAVLSSADSEYKMSMLMTLIPKLRGANKSEASSELLKLIQIQTNFYHRAETLRHLIPHLDRGQFCLGKILRNEIEAVQTTNNEIIISHFIQQMARFLDGLAAQHAVEVALTITDPWEKSKTLASLLDTAPNSIAIMDQVREAMIEFLLSLRQEHRSVVFERLADKDLFSLRLLTSVTLADIARSIEEISEWTWP